VKIRLLLGAPRRLLRSEIPLPIFVLPLSWGEVENGAMIEDTISKIEARIQSAEAIKEDRRRELVQLLGTLKSEVAELSKTHGEQAESIAGFAEVSTREATRTERNPQLLKLSLQGLSSSVRELEKSHPRLVQIVNAISNTLSNLGI
jgi:hypothetical protein